MTMKCKGCDGKGWRGVPCRPKIDIDGMIMRRCSRCRGGGEVRKVFRSYHAAGGKL